MHQLVSAREPAAQDRAALIRHPDRVELTLPLPYRLARVRESSLSVFARAPLIPVSSGLTTITRSTHGSRIRATSQQLPVTPNATRSVGSKLSASILSPSGVLGTRPPEPSLPILADRHHTELTVHIEADRSTYPSRQRHCFTSTRWCLTQGGRTSGKNDTDRYELNRSIQASRRGGQKDKPGLEAHRRKRPTRPRSPNEGPCPGSTKRSASTGQTLQTPFSCRDWRDSAGREGARVGVTGLSGPGWTFMVVSSSVMVGG